MIHSKGFKLLSLFILILILGCDNANTSKKGKVEVKTEVTNIDIDQAYKDILSANEKFVAAWNTANASDLANLYTKDGKFMESGIPAVVGTENLKTTFDSIFKANKTLLTLKTIELWAVNDLLVEEGVLTESTPEGKLLEEGKYIVLWKKEDGKWKLHRDCANSDAQ